MRGSCRERGCGDGFREPGPAPAREACDDGNDDPKDACDMCTARIATTYSEADQWAETIAAPTVGVHSEGAALLVWVEERWDGAELTWTWVAQRADYAGVQVGEPIVVLSNLPVGWGGDCSVNAFEPGWVVVCDTPHGVVARRVGLTGDISPARTVSNGWTPRAMAVPDGYELLWVDFSGLLRQRFDFEGVPTASAQLIVAGEIADVATASDNTVRALAWSAEGEVRARVYVGERVVADAALGEGGEVAVALSDTQLFAAWSNRDTDVLGDIRARGLFFDGTLVPTIDVSSRSRYAETSPTIAAAGNGFVVGWHERGGYAGANLVSFDVELPEITLVRNAVIPPGNQGGLVLASGRNDNAWALWSAGAPYGESGALRSVFMTVLAEEER